MTREQQLDLLSEEDRYLVIGIEAGWKTIKGKMYCPRCQERLRCQIFRQVRK